MSAQENKTVVANYVSAMIDGKQFGPFLKNSRSGKYLEGLSRLKGIKIESFCREEATPPPANAAPKKKPNRTFWMN